MTDEKRRRPWRELVPILRRLLPMALPGKGRLAGYLALTALASIIPLATPRLIGLAVDGIVAAETPVILILSILAVETAGLVLRYARESCAVAIGEESVLGLRRRLFAHVAALSMRDLERMPTGLPAARILDETRRVGRALLETLTTLVTAPLGLVAVAAVLCWVDWRLTIIALLPVPFLYGIIVVYVLSMREAGRRAKDRDESLASTTLEHLAGMRTIQALGREAEAEARFGGEAAAGRDAKIAEGKLIARYHPLIGFVVSAATVLVLLSGGCVAPAGTLTAGGIVSFIAYLAYLYGPMMTVTGANRVLQEMALSGERLLAILDRRPEIVGGTAALSDGGVELALEGVRYSYDGVRPALNGVDLWIPFGSRVLIAGRTGSGKTTMARVMARMIDPTEGVYRIGGVDARTLTLGSLRGCVTLVEQEGFLFSETILDNIRFGRPDATAAEVDEAIAVAGVDEILRRLPAGGGTRSGERGAALSAGERQRVILARAVLRRPRVMILDEATSALDDATEREVLTRLFDAMGGRTAIVIAHRSCARELCARDPRGMIYLLHDGALASPEG